MIHYTPLSEVDIFPPDPSSFEKQQIITIDGKQMRVEQLEDGTMRVVQLLSTDPQDFLNAKFVPGSIVSNTEM